MAAMRARDQRNHATKSAGGDIADPNRKMKWLSMTIYVRRATDHLTG